MTFEYVQPTEEQIKIMQDFRKAYAELYEKLDTYVLAMGKTRGTSLAMTKLEESNMWLNKAITKND